MMRNVVAMMGVMLGTAAWTSALSAQMGAPAPQHPASSAPERDVPAESGEDARSAAVNDASPAERATDQALQRLADAVLGSTCVSTATGATQTVASLLAFSPQAELELRRGLYGEARAGRPRRAEPGVTAVDVMLAASRIGELLTAAASRIEGAVSPGQIQLDPSAGPAVSATGTAADDREARSRWPGWRHCSEAELVLAHEAARRDLRNRLLMLLSRVPLASGQALGQFARQHLQLTESLHQQVDWINGSDPVYTPEGLCVVSATISAGQVETLATAALRDAGLSVEGTNAPNVPAGSFDLDGMSTAPPQVTTRVRIRSGPRPDWYERTLSTTASAAGPADDPDIALRNRLAIKAATVEARRQLWIELELLVLPDGRTVAQAIAAHANHNSLVRRVDAAVFELAKPTVTNEGVATVKLGLPLDRVWELVN